MNHKLPKCTNCWDKGYSTQMRGEIGSADFGGEGYFIPPTIQKNFCNCARGKRMEKLEAKGKEKE